MKKLGLIFLLLMFNVILKGINLIELKEINNPDGLIVIKDRIFISEKASIYIYLLNDYSFKKKFGREGQGPGDFHLQKFGLPLVMYNSGNKIYVNSISKLSEFDLDGNLLKEIKTPADQVFQPIGNNFVATGKHNDNNNLFLNIGLYNSDLKMTKELYCTGVRLAGDKIIFPVEPIAFCTYKNCIYIADVKNGFTVSVWDEKGNNLRKIQKSFSPEKVTTEYQNTIVNWYKNNPTYKSIFDAIKQKFEFKKYFPPMLYLFVNDNKVYSILPHQDKGKNECLVMDLQGKVLNKKFILLPNIPGNGFDTNRFYIANNRYYALVENLEKEQWELTIQELN